MCFLLKCDLTLITNNNIRSLIQSEVTEIIVCGMVDGDCVELLSVAAVAVRQKEESFTEERYW